MNYKIKIDYDDSLFGCYEIGFKYYYVIPKIITSSIVVFIGILCAIYCLITKNTFFATIILVFSAILAVFFALVIRNEVMKNKIKMNELKENLEYTIYFFDDKVVVYKFGNSNEYDYGMLKYKEAEDKIILLINNVMYPIKSSKEIKELLNKKKKN